MKEELERLIQDRNDAEDELEHLEEELSALEQAEGCDSEEWESLHREVNEQANHVAYLYSWIESYEGGYEDE